MRTSATQVASPAGQHHDLIAAKCGLRRRSGKTTCSAARSGPELWEGKETTSSKCRTTGRRGTISATVSCLVSPAPSHARTGSSNGTGKINVVMFRCGQGLGEVRGYSGLFQ